MVARDETAGSGDSLLNADQRARFDALLETMRCGLSVLDDKPEETAESALRSLWLLAAGSAVSAQGAAEVDLRPLSPPEAARLQRLVEQRLSGTPLAHLTGRQRFMGIELIAGPEALIPRRETELLGRTAAALVDQALRERHAATVIDVCTGSGNLALGIACACPQARVFAADLSHEAVQLARRNVDLLDVGHRVEIRQGDLLAPFDEPAFHDAVDVLICNPPYISSAKVPTMAPEIAQFEPALAFDGGPFGVRIIQRLLNEAPKFLRAGGWLAFEVGLGQGPAVTKRMQATQRFDELRTLEDDNGNIRAIVGRRAG